MHLGAGLTRSRLDDILRARLRTVGVTEFRFDLNKSEFLGKFGPGASLGCGWHIYDVGGHRSMVRGLSLLLMRIIPYECFLRVARYEPHWSWNGPYIYLLMNFPFDSRLGSLFR